MVFTWRRGGDTFAKTISAQGDGEDNREIDVPNSTVNMLVDMEVGLSQVKLFEVCSSKAVTLKTNSSSSPQETIALAADKPLVYIPGLGLTAPFSGDVTSIYLSNSSGAAAVVTIKLLFDSTP